MRLGRRHLIKGGEAAREGVVDVPPDVLELITRHDAVGRLGEAADLVPVAAHQVLEGDAHQEPIEPNGQSGPHDRQANKVPRIGHGNSSRDELRRAARMALLAEEFHHQIAAKREPHQKEGVVGEPLMDVMHGVVQVARAGSRVGEGRRQRLAGTPPQVERHCVHVVLQGVGEHVPEVTLVAVSVDAVDAENDRGGGRGILLVGICGRVRRKVPVQTNRPPVIERPEGLPLPQLLQVGRTFPKTDARCDVSVEADPGREVGIQIPPQLVQNAPVELRWMANGDHLYFPPHEDGQSEEQGDDFGCGCSRGGREGCLDERRGRWLLRVGHHLGGLRCCCCCIVVIVAAARPWKHRRSARALF
mmetsp:Transcript_24823/g.61373  ORF Transcript_24823/g.61373 Transcript_24823/m.61373 type:complete len:360 (+) Transcript_24823:318-1397(+)